MQLKFFWNYAIGRAVINNMEILLEIELGIKKGLDLHKLKLIQAASCIEAILEDQINRILTEKNDRDVNKVECLKHFKEYLESKKNKKTGQPSKNFKKLITYFNKNLNYLKLDANFYSRLNKVRVLRNWSHLQKNKEKSKYFPQYKEEGKVDYAKHSQESVNLLFELISVFDKLHPRSEGKSEYKKNWRYFKKQLLKEMKT